MATRLELRTRARLRADQPITTKPDDTAYNYWIDEACKRVWAQLIMAGWNVNYSSTNFVANGSATYQVTAATPSVNVFGVAGVFYNQGTDVYELKRVNQADVAQLLSVAAQSNRPEFYEIKVDATNGFVVELYPRPTAGSFTIRYIPDHPGLASDGAVWIGPNRSDELVVIAAAIKGLHNEGADQDCAQLEREFSNLLQEVMTSASWLDMRNSAMIRDTQAIHHTDPFDYPVFTPGIRF